MYVRASWEARGCLVQYLGRDYDSKAESLHTEVQSVLNVARLQEIHGEFPHHVFRPRGKAEELMENF